MKTYRNQFDRQCQADAREAGETTQQASVTYRREIRRAKRIERIAEDLLDTIERNRYTGLLPIQWTEDGFAPIAIIDCPRSWTAPQIAAFRELGEAVIAKMERNPHAAYLIRGYCTTIPAWAIDYQDRAKRDRAVQSLGIAGAFRG